MRENAGSKKQEARKQATTITISDEEQQEKLPTEAKEEQHLNEAGAERKEAAEVEKPAETEVRENPKVGVETKHHESDRAGEQEEK